MPTAHSLLAFLVAIYAIYILGPISISVKEAQLRLREAAFGEAP